MRELRLEGESNDKLRSRFDYFELALSCRTPAIFWNGHPEMHKPRVPRVLGDGNGAVLIGSSASSQSPKNMEVSQFTTLAN